MALGATLPEVEVSTSWGTPSLKVRKKMVCRVREDGVTLVVRMDLAERNALLASDDPGPFFITPHYADYPAVLIALPKVDRQELLEALAESWLMVAPKRLRAEHEERLVAEISGGLR